ncbi:MAG: urea ABC transporter permease subunit UrtC, partial [Hyphomicrobiaceae bacterium]|nr:urea ABC transporter permease subunit UrtC [Hyphomicrobiaceae bacterium]
FKDILGYNIQAQSTRVTLFLLTVALLAATFILCRLLVTSTFGKILVSIRDAESRTRFLGYKVENYKIFVFTISACLAGLAGALYVPQVGIINPSEFAPANSIEAVIWVAVGGRGTLTGAAVGALVVNFLKTSFTTGFLASYWLFALGGLFIFVTLALPKGIVGTVQDYLERRNASRAAVAGDNFDMAATEKVKS